MATPTDTRNDRQHLEDIARSALEAHDAITNPAVLSALAGTSELGAFVNAAGEREESLSTARLIEAAETGNRVLPGRVTAIATQRLEQIADRFLAVVETASEPGVPGRIATAGGAAALAAIKAGETELAGFEYTTPESAELALTAEHGQSVHQVERGNTQSVIAAALDTLEEMHLFGVEMPNNDVFEQSKAGLGQVLADAAYLLPGESTARRDPLSMQAPRGTNAQIMAIVGAANQLAGSFGESDLAGATFARIEPEKANLARLAFTQRANALKSSLLVAGFHQNMLDETSAKPVMVEDESDYEFVYIRRNDATNDGIAADQPENAVRNDLSDISDARFVNLCNRITIPSRDHESAVRALGRYFRDMENGRDAVIFMATGHASLSLAEFDRIEREQRAERESDTTPMILTPDQAVMVGKLLNDMQALTLATQDDPVVHDRVFIPSSNRNAVRSGLEAVYGDPAIFAALDQIAGGEKSAGMQPKHAALIKNAIEGIHEFHEGVYFDDDIKRIVAPMEAIDPVIPMVHEAINGGAVTGLMSHRTRLVVAPEHALAIAKVLEATNKITLASQIDTTESDRVVFPAKLGKELRESIDAIYSNPEIIGAVKEIADGVRSAPGMTPETGQTLEKTIEKAHDFIDSASVSEAGKKDMVAPMEDMDGLISSIDLSINSGVYAAMASHGGLEGFDRNTFMENHEAAAFSTLREAMSSGRSRAPDAIVGLARKPLPEMSEVHYSLLSEEARKRSRAFIMRPGEKGLFEGYETSHVAPGNFDVAQNRQSRLRQYVKDQLSGYDLEKPNEALRGALLNMQRRSIVAPNLDEARVLRELSERVLADHRKSIGLQHEKWVKENAENIEVNFGRDSMSHFVRVVEASRSDEPADLVKRGGRLVIEHRAAPTLTADMENLGLLDKAREGYRIAKINPQDLRAALTKDAADTVRLHLQNDRIVGISTSTTKSPKQGKPAEHRTADLGEMVA